MRKREEILSANLIKGTIPFSESMSQILLLEVLLDIRQLLAMIVYPNSGGSDAFEEK